MQVGGCVANFRHLTKDLCQFVVRSRGAVESRSFSVLNIGLAVSEPCFSGVRTPGSPRGARRISSRGPRGGPGLPEWIAFGVRGELKIETGWSLFWYSFYKENTPRKKKSPAGLKKLGGHPPDPPVLTHIFSIEKIQLPQFFFFQFVPHNQEGPHTKSQKI